MRIISGTNRGKRLISPDGLDVRPTSDRVKESLFNILQFQIEGRNFLDMFSGSGQIGLEAASRGADFVIMIEQNAKAAKVIAENIANTSLEDKIKLLDVDALMYIKNTNDKFDVCFLDPPYLKGIIEEALPLVASKTNEGGVIVCEHSYGESLPSQCENFVKVKTHKYGKIALSVYRHKDFT